MTPFERELFYADILRLVRKLERSHKRIYPYMLIPHLDIMRCEQTLRRDMMTLAQRGDLIRVGGPNSRRGYATPRYPRLAPNVIARAVNPRYYPARHSPPQRLLA